MLYLIVISDSLMPLLTTIVTAKYPYTCSALVRDVQEVILLSNMPFQCGRIDIYRRFHPQVLNDLQGHLRVWVRVRSLQMLSTHGRYHVSLILDDNSGQT